MSWLGRTASAAKLTRLRDIARERPPLPGSCDEPDRAGIHQIQLHVGMRRAVRGAGAGTLVPGVADETRVHVQFSDRKGLARADRSRSVKCRATKLILLRKVAPRLRRL